MSREACKHGVLLEAPCLECHAELPSGPIITVKDIRIAELEAESLRFYRADGTFEVLESAEAVVARRVECAAILHAQEAALRKLSMALGNPTLETEGGLEAALVDFAIERISTLRHDLASAQQVSLFAQELMHMGEVPL